MKLSCGLAVYNVKEKYLRACIESIMKQLTDETELLLIDDCSTDNSGEVCKEYAAKDTRVRYINMGKNGGLSAVRNRTISEAQGKWIFFADGDDIPSEHFVETALRFSGADYDIIIHNRAIFSGEKTGEEEKCSITALTELPAEASRDISLSCLCLKPLDTEKIPLGKDAYYHAAWGALYRRDFLLENNLTFPLGQKKAQDSVFNTKAYFAAKKIGYLPYKMYYYRKDMQGITQRYNADFTVVANSLIGHHFDCIKTLYNSDPEVLKAYKSNRMISLTIDSMRLNLFHPNNPKSRKERKKEFCDFINTEPYKSAIAEFDLKGCDWWGWRLPILYAQKKKFAMLDIIFKHDSIFRLLGGVTSRINKLTR
ncbi:MAG: glycosyltransferase family 2 protein [Clostridia bacterium]|nr:glycosyltransferase family 2 protein [Clostridia bacterium]